MRRRRWHIVVTVPGRVARLSGLNDMPDARASNLGRYLRRVYRKLGFAARKPKPEVFDFARAGAVGTAPPEPGRGEGAVPNLRHPESGRQSRALVAATPTTRIVVKLG